jgi:predicted O-methyltransferase YrrM
MTKPRALKKQQTLKRREQALVQATADAVAKHITNSTKQLESYMAIQHYMSTGKRLPAFHGWPISPDFGFLLIDLIEEHQYDLVIEFGSGTSTLLIAQALANVRQRRGKPNHQVAFEHLDTYHAQTQALLDAAGVAPAVQLVHAPLTDYTAPNGKSFRYYDCQAILGQLGQIYAQTEPKILVVVDGPPAATGPLARYPALHHVWPIFDGAKFDFLMDDYNRKDEKDIVRFWCDDFKINKLKPQVKRHPFEKEAALLFVNTKSI